VARALILLCLSSLAQAETRPGYGGTVQAALSAAPTGELGSGEPGDLEIASLVYDTLFRLENGKPRPHLAASLELTDTRGKLVVRGDVKLHDGTPLRAADVAASLQRALKSWMLAPIASVRALSDDTVELLLARPAPDLPLLLSTPAAMIGRDKLGTGPFVVEKMERGAVSLRAFAEHFAGRPFLDRLQLRSFASRTEEAGAYEIGSLQASRHGTSAFEGGAPRHAAHFSDGVTGVTVVLVLVAGVPAGLQAALEAGLDRERLRKIVGAPSTTTTPPRTPKTTLATRTKLGLLVDQSRFEHRALADRLLAELARIGVDASVEIVEGASYLARRAAGQYQLLLADVLPPAPELADLALVAAVDPAAARAQLGRAPATSVARPQRVIPLVHRGARVWYAAELRGVTVDATGRVGWADVHWKGRSPQRNP
jgi:peptide/nickel transport system substrate-binding protein